MQLSADRFLTSHTGSLPRPESLLPPGTDPSTIHSADPESIRQAVADTVRHQLDAGVDVVNDGEVSKVSYATYVTSRLSGFGGHGEFIQPADMIEFPEFAQRLFSDRAADQVLNSPACVGPVSYANTNEVERDLANLRDATRDSAATEVFMTAASPGVIAIFQQNQYYATDEEYLGALAEAMKTEYDAIYQAGFVLQLDCPDLAMGAHIGGRFDEAEHKRRIVPRVEAINTATRDIPADRMRMHLCWGNYEGPHHLDVPLGAIIGEVMKARPMAVSFEAANPRHEHEWTLFEDYRLPDDKAIIPGVLDSTTNYIEHPELVAQRLERYARLVGQERVIAGSDCGFATFATYLKIDPRITWAKLAAMAEGARIATDRLKRG
jgi:5-methyltetrahydropteroyltriglutamate--homocysteine methyltransferase